eukprot:g4954.t1
MATKLPSGLTAFEERACRELMKDITDQAAAYKRAGSKAKPPALRSGASRLFAKPAAKKLIASLMEKRNDSVEVDAVWVLQRLLDEANADMADIYADDGSLLPVHEMPEIWRKGLLAGVEIEETKEQLDEMKVRHRINKNDKIIDLGPFGQVIMRTMDTPERIIGFEVADSVVDELDTLPREKARDAWVKIIARNRQKKPDGSLNTVGVVTTPEGFRFVYHRWKRDPAPGYRLIKAPTQSNAKHLPDGYIQSLKDSYPENLLAAYLDGEFVNLTSGTVYTSYDRHLNASTEVIRDGDPLNVGMDFNVGKMAMVIFGSRLSMAEEFDITVKHPDYEKFAPKWETMRDVIEGEDRVKEKGETYLPMKPGIKALEGQRQTDAYSAYKARAEFPDIVVPTVNGSVGVAFDKPTEIEVPKGMEDLKERASLDGLTLDGLHQRIVTEVMRQGRYGLLPGIDEDGNFYIATYTAETVRNWDTAGRDLTYLVLDEAGQKRDPLTNKWQDEKKFRECYLVDGKYTSREWTHVSTEGNKEKYVPGEEVKATVLGKEGLGVIPFVAVGSTDLTIKPDEVPLYGLAKIALRGYRLDADYTNSLHLTSEPTPWVSGVSKEDAPDTIGAASLWVLPDADSEAGMLEFEGNGVSAQRDAIRDTRERGIMFGAQLLSETQKTAESGEALKMRLGNKHATLKSVVTTVAAGLELCLRHIAVWKGLIPDEVKVKPNLDFVDQPLTPDALRELISGWMSGAYSKRTLFGNLQRGEIVSRDVEFDDEEELIKAGLPPLAGEALTLGT